MDNYAKAIQWARHYCSRAERCSDEVLNKLGKYELDDVATKRLIEELREGDFLNEARYAGAYVADQFRFNRWGRIKIRYMLRGKNIPEALIQEALDQLSPTEYMEVLKTLIQKKQAQFAGLPDKEKHAKLMRFAYSRGFEPNLINQCLESSKNC